MFLMDMAYNGGRTLRELRASLDSDEYVYWLAYSRKLAKRNKNK